MRQIYPLILGLVVVSALASNSRAAVLANFDFQGLDATSDAPYASVDTDTNSSAGGFSIGAGLGSNGNWNTSTNGIDASSGSPAPSFAQKGRPTIAITQTESFAQNAYWSFTLTPDSGLELDLTSLTFDLSASSASTVNFQLTSSLTGFNNAIGAVTTGHSGAFSLFSYDLSGASFQNVSSPVEFRLYIWWTSGGGGSSGSASKWDNVTLNGNTVAVPEPSISVLAALGVMVVFWRRRTFGRIS